MTMCRNVGYLATYRVCVCVCVVVVVKVPYYYHKAISEIKQNE
jgi:hypothetical protein